jgi:hypothetical protein
MKCWMQRYKVVVNITISVPMNYLVMGLGIPKTNYEFKNQAVSFETSRRVYKLRVYRSRAVSQLSTYILPH